MSENLDEEIIICRCEDIKLSEIRQSIADGNLSSEEIKRSCRCGMGPCQGRLCWLTVTELMAGARGLSPQEIGYYRIRAPVKPIALEELASAPHAESDVKAVVR